MSTINNRASTTATINGTSETFTSNNASVNYESSTGLTLTKTANPTTYSAGDIIDFTITITNSGSHYLNGVRIIDNLGGGNLAYVLGSGRLTAGSTNYAVTPVATNPLTFTLQQLAVGETMTLTYKGQVIFNLPASVTTITNNVQGIGYTATGTVNGYTSSSVQKKTSEFEITKSVSVANAVPNQSYDYVITLTNNTSSDISVSNITDNLPSNFTLTEVKGRIGNTAVTTLSPSDYTLTSGNVLTIPSATGPTLSVPANGTTIAIITGYLT